MHPNPSPTTSIPTLQFHDSKIKFPLTYNLVRPSARELKTTYKAKRPTVAMF